MTRAGVLRPRPLANYCTVCRTPKRAVQRCGATAVRDAARGVIGGRSPTRCGLPGTLRAPGACPGFQLTTGWQMAENDAFLALGAPTVRRVPRPELPRVSLYAVVLLQYATRSHTATYTASTSSIHARPRPSMKATPRDDTGLSGRRARLSCEGAAGLPVAGN